MGCIAVSDLLFVRLCVVGGMFGSALAIGFGKV